MESRIVTIWLPNIYGPIIDCIKIRNKGIEECDKINTSATLPTNIKSKKYYW